MRLAGFLCFSFALISICLKLLPFWDMKGVKAGRCQGRLDLHLCILGVQMQHGRGKSLPIHTLPLFPPFSYSFTFAPPFPGLHARHFGTLVRTLAMYMFSTRVLYFGEDRSYQIGKSFATNGTKGGVLIHRNRTKKKADYGSNFRGSIQDTAYSPTLTIHALWLFLVRGWLVIISCA